MFSIFTKSCASHVLGVKNVMDKQEALQVASGSPGLEDSTAGTNSNSSNSDATQSGAFPPFFFHSNRFKVRAEDADRERGQRAVSAHIWAARSANEKDYRMLQQSRGNQQAKTT